MLLVLIFVALTLLAVYLVLPTMLRNSQTAHQDNKQYNIDIAQQRLKSLEQELENNVITSQQYDLSYKDIQNNLLFDLDKIEQESHGSTPLQRKWSVVLTVIALPVLAGLIYYKLGSPDAVNPVTQSVPPLSNPENTAANKQPSVEEMVGLLQTRLESEPDSKQGWSLLANTLMRLQRFDQAVFALQRLDELEPNNADILIRYADAVAMANKGLLEGKPLSLIRKSLEVDPNQPQALWLSGMYAAQKGQMEDALAFWARLKPLLKDQPQLAGEIDQMIQRAEQQLSAGAVALETNNQHLQSQQRVAQNSLSIKVVVSISPTLRAQFSASDTLYVVAKEKGGRPMPIAVLRQKVSNFPQTLLLDQSSVLLPQQKLSDYSGLVLKAKVSRSGQAISQAGDLSSQEVTITLGDQDLVNLVITEEL